jgi:dienelactone hydrolase
MLAALGYRPDPVPPRPEIVDRRDLGDFIREKVVFSTAPGFRVPAYVHIPKDLRGRAPAIVDLHSHGGMFLFGKEKVIDFGRNHPAMVEYHRQNYAGRPTATALARRGYVVITIDAFPFGERRLIMDEDLKYGWERSKYTLEDVKALNAKCRAKESTIVKSLTYAGLTWPGIVAWDDMRTVDYLVTRPEVDPQRIGCVGVSLGGYRSLFLAGLDDRIAAACVVGFMSTVRSMIKRHIDTHSFVHFTPALHRSLDLPDVVALRVPKPLLVLQCSRDGLFPPAGMEESVRKIAAIYDKAGSPGRFRSRFYDVPHIFDQAMQDEAFAWFDRQLKA